MARTIAELEVLIDDREGYECKNSIYSTLEQLGNGDIDTEAAYHMVLEAIAYDLMKIPKKK